MDLKKSSPYSFVINRKNHKDNNGNKKQKMKLLTNRKNTDMDIKMKYLLNNQNSSRMNDSILLTQQFDQSLCARLYSRSLGRR